MTLADDAVRAVWVDATAALGGDAGVAAERASDLVRRYGDPPRRYHDTTHVMAVLGAVADLCDEVSIDGEQRACTRAAACAHDVVHRGQAGDDERASAQWARDALVASGVGDGSAGRVHELVLTTADHRSPPDDDAAAVLLDADLSVLGRGPAGYADYVAAVRAEYAHVDDDGWRTGRSRVLRELLTRDQLFATVPGRQWWQSAARANMIAELATLTGGPAGG